MSRTNAVYGSSAWHHVPRPAGMTLGDLVRHGFAGSPLVQYLADGTARVQVVVSVAPDKGMPGAVLAVPVDIPPVHRMAELAHCMLHDGREVRYYGRERRVYRMAEADQGHWGKHPGVDAVAGVAARLLGVEDGNVEGLASLARSLLGAREGQGWKSVRLRELPAGTLVQGIGPEPCPAMAAMVATVQEAVGGRFAHDCGRLLVRVEGMPFWRLAVSDRGHVQLELREGGGYGDGRGLPAMGFVLGDGDGAGKVARSLAYLREGSTMSERGKVVSLAAEQPWSGHGCDTVVRMMGYIDTAAGHVPNLVPLAALAPVRELSERVGRGEFSDRKADWWRRVKEAWKPVSRALGDTSAMCATARVREPEGAWMMRLHACRSVADALTGLAAPQSSSVMAGRMAIPRGRYGFARQPDPPEFDQAANHVKFMVDYVHRGGMAYGLAWREANAATAALDAGSAPDTLRRFAEAVRTLANAVPDEFPNPSRATKWCLEHRPALRKAVAAWDARVAAKAAALPEGAVLH